jgi:hypothetical protein
MNRQFIGVNFIQRYFCQYEINTQRPQKKLAGIPADTIWSTPTLNYNLRRPLHGRDYHTMLVSILLSLVCTQNKPDVKVSATHKVRPD